MSPVRERLARALDALPNDVRQRHVAATKLISLPANVPPWTRTSLQLEAGAAFSLFAAGRVVLSEEAGLWNGPRLHLWARVGGRGPLLNGTQDTASFESPAEGELELCVYSGEWATRDGELATPPEAYAALSGGIEVAVVCWRGDARAGVEALAAALPDEPLLVAERERLANPTPVPPGWHYLWFLGPGDLYAATEIDGHAAIRAETADDVGILQRPVDLPFGSDTKIGWRWRVESLPSARAENSLPTHDYLSIAVEFENGQDLTYYWSAELPPETHYTCPLPNWDQRETHLVVRSGREGLGTWQAERRDLYPDYERAVGAAPSRIVGVWLIAVSVFQKGRGAAEFADIWLESGDQRVQVL